MRLENVRNGRCDLLFDADVADMLARQARLHVLGDFLRDGCDLLRLAADECDPAAEARDLMGDAASDAAAAARHDDHLPREKLWPKNRAIARAGAGFPGHFRSFPAAVAALRPRLRGAMLQSNVAYQDAPRVVVF